MNQTAKPRILLVEDDPQFVTLVQTALADTFELDVAGTITAALACLGQAHQAQALTSQAHPYCGILLDLVLPDSNQLTTLTTMLQVSRPTPIVVVTGSDLPPLQVGGAVVLAKTAIDWTLFPGLLAAFFRVPHVAGG